VKRLVIVVTSVALITGMVGCGPSAVTFADPNLEVGVREAVAIPEGPIYPSDLDSLTYLDANGKNIADLTGLECCTSLTELYLYNNQISDISPLANLTSLSNFKLGSNQISDISPLVDNEGLSEGDEVYLQENPLSQQSISEYIPQLEARGVHVYY